MKFKIDLSIYEVFLSQGTFRLSGQILHDLRKKVLNSNLFPNYTTESQKISHINTEYRLKFQATFLP